MINLLDNKNLIFEGYDNYFDRQKISFKNIEKFVEVVVEALGLEEFVKFIDFSELSSGVSAEYDFFVKGLIFNEEFISNFVDNCNSEKLNLFLTVIHEMVHANQERIKCSDSLKTINEKILIQSLLENRDVNGFIFPLYEYQAYAYSHYLLLEYSHFNNVIKEYKHRIKEALLHLIINNYFKNNLKFSAPILISNNSHCLKYDENLLFEDYSEDNIVKTLSGDIIDLKRYKKMLKYINSKGGVDEHSTFQRRLERN